ncbi:MAG: hypothetical protein ACK5PF_04400 [bacterium]|jgi:hypothetical protein
MSNVVRVAPLRTAILSVSITPASAGQTLVVAAPTGMSIRVISAAVVASGAVTVQFQSAANAITPVWALGANGGLVLPFNEHGWFQTNVGEALNINLGGAVSTGVLINYQIL